MNKRLLLAGGALLGAFTVVSVFDATPLMAQIKAALTSDVDQPGKSTVRFSGIVTQPSGQGSSTICHNPNYTVPMGKRLVIDEVSARTSNNTTTGAPTEIVLRALVGTACNSLATRSMVVTAPFGYVGSDVFNRPLYIASQHTLAYVDPGESLEVSINHLALVTNSTSYEIAISGHLVNLP